jgi:hypothetical protein
MLYPLHYQKNWVKCNKKCYSITSLRENPINLELPSLVIKWNRNISLPKKMPWIHTQKWLLNLTLFLTYNRIALGSLLDIRNGTERFLCSYSSSSVLHGIGLMLFWHWPPLWSNGQSSWLQIQRFGFDSRQNKIFWEVQGLKRAPLSLRVQLKSYLEGKVAGPV